jgi:hypothetical protein
MVNALCHGWGLGILVLFVGMSCQRMMQIMSEERWQKDLLLLVIVFD